MEEVEVRVFEVKNQLYNFAITKLKIEVDQKTLETKVKVTLMSLNVEDSASE
jgi:hypothetical protein